MPSPAAISTLAVFMDLQAWAALLNCDHDGAYAAGHKLNCWWLVLQLWQ